MPIDYKAKAEKVAEDYRVQLDSIRSEPDLNDRAKARKIKALHADTTEALADLKGKHEWQRKTHRQTLERKVWGPPIKNLTGSDMIAWRDAEDRARALTPTNYTDDPQSFYRNEEKALEMVNRAINSGDTFLVRAVVNVAMENRWPDVVNAYADTTDYRDEVAELWNLDPTIDSPGTPADRAGIDWDSAHFEIYGAEPPELRQPSEVEESAKSRSDRLGKDFAAALLEGQSEGDLTAGFGGQAGFGNAPGSVNSSAHDAGSWGVE